MKFKLFGFLVTNTLTAIAASPSTTSQHLPTANGQRPTANYQLPTASCQPPTINRPAFYKAMRENDKALVNAQLDELKTVPEDIRPAFLGAMTMKKAGLGGAPAIRLHLFKEGRKMLEDAIRQDPGNTEYRFLRLMVQEHAPGSLGYKNDLETDSDYIRKSYQTMPDEVQLIIVSYSKIRGF